MEIFGLTQVSQVTFFFPAIMVVVVVAVVVVGAVVGVVSLSSLLFSR